MTDLVYLFEIILTNNKKFHFTSSAQYQIIEDKIFVPQSGLNFKMGEFNDSAENKATIFGIFESNGGIDQGEDLSGAHVKIQYFYAKNLRLIGNFIVTKFFRHDLEFELKCETEILKYNQPLLQMFSKTCRANFGDQRCKVNVDDISLPSHIIELNGNMLVCDINGINDGYFKDGKIIIVDNMTEYKIISHFRNNIEVNDTYITKFFPMQKIILVPGCDKNYRTCCYSFNNAVNFRGEPAIPEFNIIEN